MFIRFLKRVFYFFLFIAFVVASIAGYLYFEEFQIERQNKELDKLAERYHREKPIATSIIAMKNLYNKNHNETIAVYKAKNELDTYSKHAYKRSKEKLLSEALPIDRLLIMFKEKEFYKVYKNAHLNETVQDNWYLMTFEEAVIKANLVKLYDMNNTSDFMASYNQMIVEIKSHSDEPYVTHSIKAINGRWERNKALMNKLQQLSGEKQTYERPLIVKIFNFIGDYILWVIGIFILFAIAGGSSGGSTSSSSESTRSDNKSSTSRKKVSTRETPKARKKEEVGVYIVNEGGYNDQKIRVYSDGQTFTAVSNRRDIEANSFQGIGPLIYETFKGEKEFRMIESRKY